MSKRQFIRKSMKEWDSNDGHDWTEKTKIASVLKEGFQYYCVYDRTIFVNKQDFTYTDQQPNLLNKDEIFARYEVFRPDILIKPHNIIIEIDGDFHFNTAKGIKQTNHRNEIYEYMGVRFVWFTKKSVQDYSAAELYQILKEKL